MWLWLWGHCGQRLRDQHLVPWAVGTIKHISEGVQGLWDVAQAFFTPASLVSLARALPPLPTAGPSPLTAQRRHPFSTVCLVLGERAWSQGPWGEGSNGSGCGLSPGACGEFSGQILRRGSMVLTCWPLPALMIPSLHFVNTCHRGQA